MRIKKISGYVECSAMNDPESVKKVFEKACKLGLSQVTGISIPTDDVDGLMQDDENVGCFDKFFKKCNKQWNLLYSIYNNVCRWWLLGETRILTGKH